MEDGKFGGKMELLKLSRLKLHLRALISDARDLRERERSTTEQLHLSIQKQKQSEEEFGRNMKDLEAELASSIELRQKLERKVSYLQNDNALLENKQKELNGIIQSLLQSREHFINAYQDSTCELKRSTETKDRKLKVFSEKLKSHILLFDSIEKEALSVKQVVENVEHAVNEKEEIVTGLKRKFDRISEIEKVFMEKLSEMECSLKRYKDELQMKDKMILELYTKLEAEQICNNNQAQIEEIQRTLSMKEAVIQNLISEKQALDSEVKSLAAILEKIQQSIKEVNEGRTSFPSVFEIKGRYHMILGGEVQRIEDSKSDIRKDSESQPALGGSAEFTVAELPEKNEPEFHSGEPACSTTQSACSGPQSTSHAQTMSINEAKRNCTITVCRSVSESSTTQAESSVHPG